MRVLMLLAFLTVGATAFGQSNEFDALKKKSKNLAEKSQWDELMLAAPEMITSEPGRYEGYYFTALAFNKINESDKALEYIAIAEQMASDEEKKIVKALRQEIEQQSMLDAKSKEIVGKGQEQDAEASRKLWELDKTNLDYALTAIELYLDKNDYPSALAILSDSSFANDPKAKKLAEVINKKPEMVRLNAYTKAMQAGKRNFDLDRYDQAIPKFDEALKIFPRDADAAQMKRAALDELAWQQAKKENSFNSYQDYRKQYPSGKYRTRVDEILQNGYLEYARKYKSEKKFAESERYYLLYQKEFPEGPEINKVYFELCNLYYAEAKKREQVKTAASIKSALQMYANVQKCSPGAVSQSHLTALRKKEKKWSRPSVGFFGWSADENNLFGITAGSMNTRKVGFYFAGRTSAMMLESVTSWETDDNASLENSPGKEKSFVKDYSRAAFATMGITKKIVHPLWIYAGAGIAVNQPVKKFKYNNSGSEEFVVNADQKYMTVNPEIGIHLKLSFITLRYGINKPITDKFKDDFMQNFGIAFCF